MYQFEKGIAKIDRQIVGLQEQRSALQSTLDAERRRLYFQNGSLVHSKGTSTYRQRQRTLKRSFDGLGRSMAMINTITQQYIHSLQRMQHKMRVFEGVHSSWTPQEVVAWFDSVDGGILKSSTAFKRFKSNLVENGVSGSNSKGINDFSLKLAGLQDALPN